MLQKIIRFIGGDPNKREIAQFSVIVEEINELEESYQALSDDALLAKTAEFRQRLADGETLDDLLHEAFAAVREASKRTNGQRPFDVQLIGGITLHKGKIAEMRTGEGKTLMATLPLYLNALVGKGAHLVTVNDYLARRDARWMSPIYRALGMSVGVLQMAARTENGRNAFVVDPDKKSPHEDQDQLRVVLRKEAYDADITYGTNSEFGFDYLRDNLTMRLDERVQRGHSYAIVDEVDNILIDEARTPLIISGPASDDTEWYVKMAQVVRQLNPEDYEINEKDRTVTLTELGDAHVEQVLGIPLRDPERPEDVTPEQARLFGYLEQCLRAQFLFRRNKDYLVQASKVVIVDEFTGRLMPGRRWSDGLHQAVEAKEGVKIEPENITYATITLQNYFRMYAKLGGMTGTALTEAEEFYKIYKLDVLPIPTNLEFQTFGKEGELVEVEARDDQNYKYSYFARRDDPEKKIVWWRRKDFPDVVYRTEEAKLRAITKEIIFYHIKGRPQLVGTTSVEHSEHLSDRLHADPVKRLLQTMLIRKIWLVKNNKEANEMAIPELQPLYKPVEEIQATDLRQMSRPLGMSSINPEDESNLPHILELLDLQAEDQPRLLAVIQGGVKHSVLNARKHDEESQIIAGAGAFGAVTIATNMAGRGVDIKLGGELPEESLAGVNRILARTTAVGADPYNMTMEQREQALRAASPEDYGIYEADAQTFLKYMDDMRAVRRLGGLHVIGSERHEARRIDNQLRGRAARQGDPGSSRFYLSLGDELMRLFGGAQVENLMTRLNIDEATPIESGIVGRLVEQSQTRVEGANFDVRKHLLEYDDVLNSQRNRIYGQRDKVFIKEDLTEDVTEMLRTELQERIPKALKDDEGPWRLLAYLEEIQPPLDFPGVVFPSYPIQLLLNSLGGFDSVASLRASLLELAERSLQSEHEHILRSFRTLLEKSEDTIKTQEAQYLEALDNYLDGLKESRHEEEEETPAPPRRPQEIVDELSGLVATPLKLSPNQVRDLTSGDTREVAEDIRAQIRLSMVTLTTTRAIATIERRLEESLGLKPTQFQNRPWREVADELIGIAETAIDNRRAWLLGEGGQIPKDLDANAVRLQAALTDTGELIRLLALMAQGARVTFDTRTHQRMRTVTTRLRYVYLAARMVEESDPQRITQAVLVHLEEAQEKMTQVFGLVEWNAIDRAVKKVGDLDDHIQRRLEAAWEKHGLDELRDVPLDLLTAEDQQTVISAIGKRTQTEIYRQILLGVISENWVDYLTRIEALRVSIGLEAYAQRDPLVMYKGRASVMFKELLSDIRAGTISRMFTYRPRQVTPTPVEKERLESARPTAEKAPARPPQASRPSGKKRKRH